ncbi:MAG: hypothetical protein WBL51_00250 [Acidimicrobiales bacterium]
MITVPVVATLVGGATLNATLAGVPPVTVIAALEAAVIKLLVLSVATRMQLPVWLTVTALNVATPATSAVDKVPPRVHVEPIAMVSVPDVTTFPYWSSLDTLKVVSSSPAPDVVGGAVVNASFAAVVGLTVIAPLVMGVPVSPVVVSVAVSVHDVPVLMITLLNVATKGFEPPDASSVNVELPLNVQDEEITMASLVAPPAVTLTVNVLNAVPAVAVVGTLEKVSVDAAAAAGTTPTNATPASNNAVPRPAPTIDFALDETERRPTSLRLKIFMERLL